MIKVEQNLTVTIDGASWSATYAPSTGNVKATVAWEHLWNMEYGKIPDEFVNCVIQLINAVEPDPVMPDDIREEIRRVSQVAYERRIQPRTIGHTPYVPHRHFNDDVFPYSMAESSNLDQRFGRTGRTDHEPEPLTHFDHATEMNFVYAEIPLEMTNDGSAERYPYTNPSVKYFEEESDML
jgi:hypothetical protein